MSRAHGGVLIGYLGHEARAQIATQQIRHHTYRARRILDVHGRPAIGRRDLDRRMRARGGRAADQERQVHAALLHFARDQHHLLKGGRNQARHTDHIGLLALGGVEDVFHRHHHTEVDDFEIIALEHHADDVLANVVHVTLDGGQHDLSQRAGVAGSLLAFLDEGDEMGHCTLHDARTLDHLRQEHLARTE